MNKAHRPVERWSERGMALITALMLLFMASSLLVGFLTVVMADSRVRRVDKTRTQSFYAAYAGLEKLTSDLGNLFMVDFSPSPSQIQAVEAAVPSMPQVQFTAEDGLGYNIAYVGEPGVPVAAAGPIPAGAFEGLQGLVTRYDMTTTARTSDGAESRVARTLVTASLPVFQFGIFSNGDLTFSANADLQFGGRVHTNGNLWLTAATGGTTYLADRVTVVGEVIRTHLANGRLNDGTHEGTVKMAKAPGSYRNLLETEGSVLNNLGSAVNEPTWTNLSIGTYNSYIRNSRTGAKVLNLPFVSLGATPIDLIRRPVINPPENALITNQRLFIQSQIRILLSDTSAEITNLPGVSAGATPFIANATLGGNAIPVGQTPGPNGFGARAMQGIPVQSGFIKIERRTNAMGADGQPGTIDDVWADVTAEWLGLGYTKKNFDALTGAGAAQCTVEPSPNAIIRFQRIRENIDGALVSAPCGTANANGSGAPSNQARNYWPLTLYDVRESWARDNLDNNDNNAAARQLYLGGVMHYIELDVNNLRLWIQGAIGATGNQIPNENGYAIYFSDRRLNKNGLVETGEYGFEDHVNPADANGTPNGGLNDGEDLNENNQLDNYGMVPPIPAGGWGAGVAPASWMAPLNAAATPRTPLTAACLPAPWVGACPSDTPMNKARSNPAILFRRALKVVNGMTVGGVGALPPSGLTITSENPVYVEGNYNATAGAFGNPSAPAAILADAITLLSSNWSIPMQMSYDAAANVNTGHGDTRSFMDPNEPTSRPAASTRYRFAALAGKIRSFQQLNLPASFGTDGGIHNFLRLIESWTGDTLSYNGSVASFYYSRQGIGLFRCCTNVYQLPARDFAFDINFLNPNLLPPKTPMFRDINITRFRYVTK